MTAGSNTYRTFWQILIWGFGWLLVVALFTNINLNHFNRFVYRGLVQFFGIAVIIAININYLLPRFYFKKQVGFYILLGISLVILVTVLLHSQLFPWAEWFDIIPDKMQRRPKLFRPRQVRGLKWLGDMIPFIIAFIGSTSVEIARFANQKEKDLILSEKEKLATEIKFLKSQINPHFLFNVLNNVYTLSVIKSDKAPENILRLSEMLRYMLYDSNEGNVALKKEIDYLKNYINLTKLKDSRGLNVQVSLDESRPYLKVAPLLFIPFVENAFKHSKIEDLKNGQIVIELKTFDDYLEFKVENSIPEKSFPKDKVGGIGLSNIKKRLDLLYPKKHELNISNNENTFSVFLKLDLT